MVTMDAMKKKWTQKGSVINTACAGLFHDTSAINIFKVNQLLDSKVAKYLRLVFFAKKLRHAAMRTEKQLLLEEKSKTCIGHRKEPK